MAPASGGATVEKPVMNRAATTEAIPHFSKIDSVWRTQESGDNETRHNVFSTRRPYRLPRKYQAVSTRSDAATAAPSSARNESSPARTSDPATIRVGSAGIG